MEGTLKGEEGLKVLQIKRTAGAKVLRPESTWTAS